MEFNILNGLNDEQKEAVTTTEGYVRVIAGAGSGKTKALTSRYIYIVNELGISTANILCVTFTNKAAKEMKKRIRNIIGDNDTGLICTFHSFCRQMLREDIHAINYPNNFIVMDTEDTKTILKIVYEQANISSKQYTFTKMLEMINKRKNVMEHIPYMIEPSSDILKEKFLYSEKVEDRVFFGYLYQQRKSFNLDFSDLITFAVYILDTFEEKRVKWQKKLEYVMVDEFQDVNSLQYQLAKSLSGYHQNLFVVGDPDQTIYSWRGARIEYILNFDKMFPDVKTIFMTKNYRSTENILNASNSLIDKNENRIKKDLIAIRKPYDKVIYNHSKTIYDEARWIAKQVKDIKSKGEKYNDICILYRAHYVSRSIEEVFIKEEIPYILYSGVGFYERKEVKDVLSYLRMVIFEDDLSFIRIINEPKRNFGKKRMEIIQKYAEINNCSLYNSLKYNIEDNLISNSKASDFIDLIDKYQKVYKEMTITDLLIEMLNMSGYEEMLRVSGEDDRLDNLAELKNSIVDYENSAGEETSLEDYLQEIALYTNSDLKEESDKVKMMTIHTAKGLEFPYVFISGLNEGIFPSSRADTKNKLEEERRLAYVGYTRAEKFLFLSEAEGINYDGSFRYPSRFIFNTDKKYLNYISNLEKNLEEEASEYICASERKYKAADVITFKKGDSVIHNIFGSGVVKEINHENSSYIIQFTTKGTERNISFTTKLVRENNKNKFECEREKGKLEQRAKESAKEEARKLEEASVKAEQEEVKRLEEARRKVEQDEARRLGEKRRKAIEEVVIIIEKIRMKAAQEELIRLEEARIKAEQEEARRLEEARIKVEQEEARRLGEKRRKAIEEVVIIIEKIRMKAAQEELIRLEEVRAKEEQEESRRLEEARIKAEQEETRRLEEVKRKLEKESKRKVKEKEEILKAIQEQETIIRRNRYSFWGKGALKKKEAKELLIILNYKLTNLQ